MEPFICTNEFKKELLTDYFSARYILPEKWNEEGIIFKIVDNKILVIDKDIVSIVTIEDLLGKWSKYSIGKTYKKLYKMETKTEDITENNKPLGYDNTRQITLNEIMVKFKPTPAFDYTQKLWMEKMILLFIIMVSVKI